ncbi:MAG: tyrosine-type recombinase/integrase [Xanthobacteraceae bacterium]|jgi:integrase
MAQKTVTLSGPEHVGAIIDFQGIGTFPDSQVHGLYLRAGPRKASFYFHSDKQVRGERRVRRVKLGEYPAIGLIEARRLADIERGDIAAGKVARGKNSATKIGAAFDEYLAFLKRKAEKAKKDPRWHRNATYLYKQLIEPKWSAWSLCDLVNEPALLRDWHRKLTKDNGPVSANHALRLIRAAYKYAAKLDVTLPERNPCSAVEWNDEEPKQSAMPFKEFPAWLAAWNALRNTKDHNKPVRHFAPNRKEFHLFGLLTGARPGEIARLRWRDVKPSARCVEIPNAKASKTIRIIMSASIARVLKRARDITEPKNADALIFPHCEQISSRDALPYRGHDLRHTWKTVASECKVGDLFTGIMLGHMPEGVSEKYITRHVLTTGTELRAAQRKVSARIVKLLGKDPTRGKS